MADIQLNSVTLATESGGTVSLDSGVASIPAAGITGTLGSGITFPTGHVIQTVGTRSSQSSISHTVGDTYVAAGYPISMTAAQTNGKYLVNFFSGRIDSNGSTARCAITLYKNENGAGYSEVSGVHASTGLNMEFLGDYTGSTHFTYLYTASITAGQTIAFQVYYQKISGNGTSVHLTNGGAQFEFIAQEIAL